MSIFSRSSLLISFVIFGAAPAFAADPMPQHNSNAVWFENWTGLTNATLKVVAPNGQITEIFAASGTPVFQLSGGEILDGVYRYELSAATAERETIVNPIDSGRGDTQSDTVAIGYNLNGVFSVSRGAIIAPEEVNEESEG